MSINHCYSSELPEAHQWRSQYMVNINSNTNIHHSSLFSKTSISPNFNPNHLNHRRAGAINNFSNDGDEDRLIDEQRENPRTEQNEMPLFEKPLTPSDVGKLNRLVIPKQHAEKYFPINGGDSGEKGLLLGFEDEIGKSWRFRYSYWNSSQSYVLTKGWSRFVKEKKLDAGDIVLFKRHSIDAARLFIGWRRRSSEKDSGGAPPVAAVAGGGVTGGWNRMFYSSHGFSSQHQGPCTLPYNPNNAGTISHNQTSNGNPKRLRLFGVNLECHVDESSEPSTSDGSPMSSQGQTSYHSYYHSNSHLDISFSGGGDDVLYHRQG